MRNLFFAMLIAVGSLAACTDSAHDDPNSDSGSGGNDGNTPPVVDTSIVDYDGETASDASSDLADPTTGNADLYYEANSFSNTVAVTFSEGAASVTSSNSNIAYYIDGAYVTIDLQSVSGTEITLQGKASAGGVKIYGSKKYKLTLNGVELASAKGPSINSQCSKRVFLHLTNGTTNRLTDAATYSDDSYYPTGVASDDEDRKGCLFSEGNIVVSGTGVLVVAGKQKHAIATDGYFWMRPGATIAVSAAAKNALHVKGDSDDAIGIHIAGGLFYANVASTAGKCMKCDLDIEVAGGKLLLNTSGGSEYDADEADTSSPACIKADGNVEITGGEITMKSTGAGGKGINADGTLHVTGGQITAITSGSKYVYNASLDSSPKGIKAEGDIRIEGGSISISATGNNEGAEGLESKSSIYISGGEVYSYAYDDAINAATSINISGGKVYAFAVNNDGMDSNGTITVSGGLVISSGTSAPEEGFDCDQNTFKITGGTLIGMGGATSTPTASVCTQRSVIYNGISATQNAVMSIYDGSKNPLVHFQFPRTMNSVCLLFSSPDLAANSSYTISTGDSVSNPTESWNGWYSGGTWSAGSTAGTFTTGTTMVTTVGNSGGGIGGGPGGRP